MSPGDVRLADLLERLLEGSLDADGRVELATLLRAQPQARRVLAEQLDLDAVLAEHFSGEDFVGATVDRLLAARAAPASAVDPRRIASAKHHRAPGAVRVAGPRSALRAPRLRQRRASAWMSGVLLAAACVALLAAGAWLLAPQQEVAPESVARVEGSATLALRRSGGAAVSLADGGAALPGDELSADAGGMSLRFGDGSVVRFAAGTAVRLEGDGSAKRLELRRGRIEAEVAPQRDSRSMVFAAPGAEATVVGTRLALSTSDGRVRLEVGHGEVRLRRRSDRSEVLVAAGQWAESAPGVELAVRALGAAPPTAAVARAPRVLFLRQHPDDDLRAERRLRALGCDVTVVSDAAATVADAEGVDLVVIPESVLAAHAGDKFRDVRVPLLTWEPGIYPRLGLGSGSEIAAMTSLTIAAPSHPLAAGLTGTVRVVASAGTAAGVPKPPSGATVIARAGDARGTAALVAAEAGAELAAGFRAPARRVFLFLHGRAEDQLTDAGWALFDASVRWCLGDRAPVAATASPPAPAGSPATEGSE